MIDGNSIIDGDGPYTPTRCGSAPAVDIIRLCFSGKKTEKEMLALFMKSGGLTDLLGTSDGLEVDRRVAGGDGFAKIAHDGMAYQVIKQIGAMACALHGSIDGILVGGGLARDKAMIADIKAACAFLGPITVYPGEFEMEALASGALRVLRGEEEAKRYTGKPVWSGFDFK
jgi:butyrate kinase